MSSTETQPRAQGAPLGPGSLLWSIAGDPRGLITGTAAGLMQLMLPGLGAGVTDHSNFFDDPYDRIFRSIPYIWGSIFAEGDGADERGRTIRDFHTEIKGTDDHGRRYHALDPEIFWWAHATFTWEFFRAHELYFPGRLRRSQQEQLYAETVTWFRRYGVSDRAVPPTLDAFRVRFEQICAHELELTPAVSWVLDPKTNPGPAERPRLPGPALHPRRARRPLRVGGAPTARVRLHARPPPATFRLPVVERRPTQVRHGVRRAPGGRPGHPTRRAVERLARGNPTPRPCQTEPGDRGRSEPAKGRPRLTPATGALRDPVDQEPTADHTAASSRTPASRGRISSRQPGPMLSKANRCWGLSRSKPACSRNNRVPEPSATRCHVRVQSANVYESRRGSSTSSTTHGTAPQPGISSRNSWPTWVRCCRAPTTWPGARCGDGLHTRLGAER